MVIWSLFGSWKWTPDVMNSINFRETTKIMNKIETIPYSP